MRRLRLAMVCTPPSQCLPSPPLCVCSPVCLSQEFKVYSVSRLTIFWWYNVTMLNACTEAHAFASLKQWKGGKHCEGGVHTVASLNLLIEKTDFAFYSIKIRLETPEMIPTLGTWWRTDRQTNIFFWDRKNIKKMGTKTNFFFRRTK